MRSARCNPARWCSRLPCAGCRRYCGRFVRTCLNQSHSNKVERVNIFMRRGLLHCTVQHLDTRNCRDNKDQSSIRVPNLAHTIGCTCKCEVGLICPSVSKRVPVSCQMTLVKPSGLTPTIPIVKSALTHAITKA